jgi:2'-5' RNA ligase
MMPYAVTLGLDAVTDDVVAGLIRALAEHGIDDERLTLGYGAHVTLAIFGDSAPVDTIDAALRAQAVNWSCLPVSLVGFDLFPAARSVVFVKPAVSALLRAWQADLHAALADLPCDPHYAPGAWVPHVTLGSAADPAAALAVLAPSWRGPIAARFTHADLVRFRPVDILCRIALAGDPEGERGA